MNHKTLAIILVVLLGGMAVYYNQATSDNPPKDPPKNPPKVEASK